jgi:hypothetical protein
MGLKRRSIQPEFKMGSVSVKFLTIIIFSVLAVFYLVQSQMSSGKRQEVKNIQDIQEELVQKTEQLQIQSNQLKSISSIEQAAASMQMAQATNVIYADNLPQNQLSQNK